MSEKKKISVAKAVPDRRMSNPPTPKNSKNQDGTRSAGTQRQSAAAAQSVRSSEKQLNQFEAAMKHFHARRFKEAREGFLQAADGPERDVSHRAKLHATMCERRLPQPALNLRTAEEHYNYGVAMLNTRKVDDARVHLEQALEMAPDSDHIHYALALVQALSGNVSGAHEHLKRAIELEPKNRLLARQDTDLASIAGQPSMQALLYPEKKSW